MTFDIEKELDYAHNIISFINQYRNLFNGINRYHFWDDSIELLVVDEITRSQLIDIMLSQGLVQDESNPLWFYFPDDFAYRQLVAGKWLSLAFPEGIDLRRQAGFRLDIHPKICLCKPKTFPQPYDYCTPDCTKVESVFLVASFN